MANLAVYVQAIHVFFAACIKELVLSEIGAVTRSTKQPFSGTSRGNGKSVFAFIMIILLSW